MNSKFNKIFESTLDTLHKYEKQRISDEKKYPSFEVKTNRSLLDDELRSIFGKDVVTIGTSDKVSVVKIEPKDFEKITPQQEKKLRASINNSRYGSVIVSLPPNYKNVIAEQQETQQVEYIDPHTKKKVKEELNDTQIDDLIASDIKILKIDGEKYEGE